MYTPTHLEGINIANRFIALNAFSLQKNSISSIAISEVLKKEFGFYVYEDSFINITITVKIMFTKIIRTLKNLSQQK